MAENVFECPFCHRKFRLPTDTASERILCPHCTQVVELPRADKSSDSRALEKQSSTINASLDSIVTKCPTCSGAFQVLPSMLGQWVACPHCHSRLQIVGPDSSSESTEMPPASGLITPKSQPPVQDFEIPKPARKAARKTPDDKPAVLASLGNSLATESSSVPISRPDSTKIPPDVEPSVTQTGNSAPALSETLDPELAKLLPPKFLVPGAMPKAATATDGNIVLLPDAHGGFKAIDTSIRQINFSGQSVAITSLPESIKRRRRQIRAIVLFSICGVLLLFAFYWLSR